MKIISRRFLFSPLSTISRVFVGDEFICYVLEDVTRLAGVKISGETAIPYGEYAVEVTFSPHFQRNLPLLVDVPNYAGVRIHPGNKPADTEGCLLPGMTYDTDVVNNSRDAFAVLFGKILNAKAVGEQVTISIEKVEMPDAVV